MPGRVSRRDGRRCTARRFANPLPTLRSRIRVGNGLDDGVQMGPVISSESTASHSSRSSRAACSEGAAPMVDGRNARSTAIGAVDPSLRPTVLDGLPAYEQPRRTPRSSGRCSVSCTCGRSMRRSSSCAAARTATRRPLFTTSGAIARRFRYEAPAGNIGINIGVAAPMAYFPFSGWKDSFFGILHGQGRDAVEFYTESKVVVERWSRQETRKF